MVPHVALEKNRLAHFELPVPPDAPDAPVKSLCRHSYIEALRYKWLASEKAGRDLGERAILEWLGEHWAGWCRARWIEHVTGCTCWAEFDCTAFGTLQRRFQGDVLLLDRVLDRVRCGWENLDIIIWAADWKLDIEAIVGILELLDINRSRLDPDTLFALEDV